jgi:hypothetical protein
MMDLSSLDSTLPPALADAERDMGDKFRGRSCSGPYKQMGMVVDIIMIRDGGQEKGMPT